MSRKKRKPRSHGGIVGCEISRDQISRVFLPKISPMISRALRMTKGRAMRTARVNIVVPF
nr:MAG TPA: hypothetical protein [Caudoviricetes sp.]